MTQSIYEVQHPTNKIFHQYSLKEVLFVYYQCPRREKLIQEYAPCNQFVFAINGRKTFNRAECSWTLSEDSGYLLRWKDFKKKIHEKSDGLELLVLYLNDEYLKEVYNEFRSHLPLYNLPSPPKEMIIRMDVDGRIRNCYTSLIPYFNQSLPLPESILEMKFKELIYNILINPANKSILSYINGLGDRYETPVWEVMEKNFMYDLKLSEYARMSNRSLASFKREFQKCYGVSPGKWLTQKRLQRAKMFLETSHRSVSEIAFDNGYSNVSHFSRVFKTRFGKSPVDYRNAYSSG